MFFLTRTTDLFMTFMKILRSKYVTVDYNHKGFANYYTLGID